MSINMLVSFSIKDDDLNFKVSWGKKKKGYLHMLLKRFHNLKDFP